MSGNKNFDPYDTFKKFNDQWEKQMNDLIHLWTNNSEFVKFTRAGTDSHTRYLELFKKNQELLANQLNLPTKSDLANVAKLSIQTEDKLDSLEEQIWKLQDSISGTSKEIEGIVDVSREVIKLTKQLKTEMTRTKKELAEVKSLNSELQDVKNELEELQSLKDEIATLKDLIFEDTDVAKEAEHEPVQADTAATAEGISESVEADSTTNVEEKIRELVGSTTK